MADEERVWGRAETRADVEERREHAGRLTGLALASVRCFDIDYQRGQVTSASKGPRQILDPAEWATPTWEYPDCDSVDFGIELTTVCNRTFSIKWDPPGPHEGLGLREAPLLPTFNPDADLAVWDVTDASGWRALIGHSVTGAVLHYLPWDDLPTGYWCPRFTLHLGAQRVEFLLGEGFPSGGVGRAANNVAVQFDPPELPGWDKTH